MSALPTSNFSGSLQDFSDIADADEDMESEYGSDEGEAPDSPIHPNNDFLSQIVQPVLCLTLFPPLAWLPCLFLHLVQLLVPPLFTPFAMPETACTHTVNLLSLVHRHDGLCP